MNRTSETNAITRLLRPICRQCGNKVHDNHHPKHDQTRPGVSLCSSCHKIKDNRGK